jgi:hypothetical protein
MQITAVLDGKAVIAPPREVQEVRNAIKVYEKLTNKFKFIMKYRAKNEWMFATARQPIK